MKKYIYSPHHQGLVLAPLMGKPDKDRFRGIDPGFFEFDHIGYNKAVAAYNTWLSSPPIYKVRPEDIEWFSVERGEDEFEVKRSARFEAEITDGTVKRFAIPKKGNESKEQIHEPDFENDPYWIGQAYLQDKQLLEIEKMFDDNGLRLELTCSACPEQYDVFLKVGYLRLRHGEFRVDYPDCGGETIYEAEPNGDGIFNKDERVKYMEEAMKSILKMLNKDHSPTL
jgi:hypothetical protein